MLIIHGAPYAYPIRNEVPALRFCDRSKHLDLNDLYHRHGAAQMRAMAACASDARAFYEEAAGILARQIADTCPTAYRKTYLAGEGRPPDVPNLEGSSLFSDTLA